MKKWFSSPGFPGFREFFSSPRISLARNWKFVLLPRFADKNGALLWQYVVMVSLRLQRAPRHTLRCVLLATGVIRF